MTRWSHQTDFSRGWLSESFLGHSDAELYRRGLRQALNVFITQTGTIKKRPGGLYIGGTYLNQPAVLVPYYVRTLALQGDFIVEFTAGQIQVWRANGTLIVAGGTLTNPYTAAELETINFAQSTEALFVTHKDHEPRVLNAALTEFVALDANNSGPRWNFLSRTNSMTWTTGDNLITTDDHFVNTDAATPEKTIWYFNGGIVTGDIFTSSKRIEITNYANEIPVSTGPSLDWTGPWIPRVASGIVLSTASGKTRMQIMNVTAASALFVATDVGNFVHWSSNANPLLIMKFNSTTDVDVLVFNNTITTGSSTNSTIYDYYPRGLKRRPIVFNDAEEGTVKLTSTEKIWDSASVPASGEQKPLFFCQNGVVRLTTYTSDTEVTGTVVSKLSQIGISVAWSQGYDPYTGYPTAIGFHQNRLWLGGCLRFPSTVTASGTAQHRNFGPGPLADDPLSFEITTERGDAVTWFASAQDLLTGTENEELILTGTPITPTAIGVDTQSTYGSAPIDPVRVGPSALFVTRDKKRLREMAFRFERDRYISADLTQTADHLFEDSTIRRTVYVSAPEHIVYVLLLDGTLLAMGYDRETDIVGWSQYTNLNTQGLASLSTSIEDELWLVVKRAVNATTQYFIEAIKQSPGLDSHVKYSSPFTTKVLTGLTHLVAETVEAFIDGGSDGTYTVNSDGEITVSKIPETEAYVGLPITATVKPQFIPTPTQDGFNAGIFTTVASAMVQVKDTKHLLIEGQEVIGIKINQAIDDTFDKRSGWFKMTSTTVSGEDPVITITHTKSTPMHIVAIAQNVERSEL